MYRCVFILQEQTEEQQLESLKALPSKWCLDDFSFDILALKKNVIDNPWHAAIFPNVYYEIKTEHSLTCNFIL